MTPSAPASIAAPTLTCWLPTVDTATMPLPLAALIVPAAPVETDSAPVIELATMASPVVVSIAPL